MADGITYPLADIMTDTWPGGELLNSKGEYEEFAPNTLARTDLGLWVDPSHVQEANLTSSLAAGFSGYIKADFTTVSADPAEFQRFFEISDGTKDNRFLLGSIGGKLGLVYTSEGSAVAGFETNSLTPGLRTIAFACGLGFFRLQLVGADPVTNPPDTSSVYAAVVNGTYVVKRLSLVIGEPNPETWAATLQRAALA